MMNKRIIVLISAFTFLLGGLSAYAEEVKYLSPLSVAASKDGSTLYVAKATAEQIAFYDISEQKVTKNIGVEGEISGLSLSPCGKVLYVTSGHYDGIVSIIDIKSASVVDVIKVGHTPISPVPSPDGKVLYVCNRMNHNVIIVDLESKKIIAEIPVTREPAAAAITPDGKKLFVSNFLPAGRVDGDFVASEVTVIDTDSKKTITNVVLPNGSINLHGIGISPDGKYVYVTHVLARYQLPTTQLERGWMNTNAMTIIDARQNKMFTTVLLDDVDLGAANPWGVACTEDGKYICVAHAGSHEISVIDRQAMHKKIDDVINGRKVSEVSSSLEDIPNDLSFLVGLRRRIPLTGVGPRNLTLIGTTVYVPEYFTDSIGVLDIDPAVRPKAKSLKLGPEVEMTSARRGEMYFHDASLCFQKWQSCATCHPSNARPDALNWDLLNDGMGNPKNTKSLLFSHETPPSMMTGVRASAEVGVRAGIRFIQFAVRPEEDAADIDEYLKALRPVPSPRLVKKDGKLVLSDSAERGRKVFMKANCVMCHSGKYLTNMKKFNVGTGHGMEEGTAFDTPTLIEVWRTAPYLYDGRAATMKEVFTEFNKEDKHGKTKGLTEQELNDLVEYVLSL